MSGVVGWWYEGDACQPDFRRRLANHGDEVADLVRNLRTAILTARPELTERIYPRLARLGLPPPASDPRATACSWSAALGVPPPLARVTCFRSSQPSCGTAGGRLRRERIGSVTAVPSVSHSITVRLEVPAGGASVSQLTTAVERAYGPTELQTDTEVAP